jgi:hypothetical protein
MQYEISIRKAPTGIETRNATNGHVYDYFGTPAKKQKTQHPRTISHLQINQIWQTYQ